MEQMTVNEIILAGIAGVVMFGIVYFMLVGTIILLGG